MGSPAQVAAKLCAGRWSTSIRFDEDANTPLPAVGSGSSKRNDVNVEMELNAPDPMVVTEAGITTSTRPVL